MDATMYLYCDECDSKLTSHSRPPQMNHTADKTQLFVSYLHCSKCGASYKAEVKKELVRSPLNTNLFNKAA